MSSRPATSAEILQALQRLFRVLPLRKGTVDDLTDGYLEALAGRSRDGLELAVTRLVRGEIDELSKSWAPTGPELASLVRKIERQTRDLDRLTAAPEPPPAREKPTGYCTLLNLEYQAWKAAAPPGPLMQAAFDKHYPNHPAASHGGRPLIEIADSFSQAQRLAKQMPPGVTYVARFGAFYAAPPKERTDDADGFSEPTGRPVDNISPDGPAEDDGITIDAEDLDDADDDHRGLAEDQGAAGPD